MAAYALRRLLWLGPVLLFISIVTFGLMHSVEGDPWSDRFPAPPPETQANLERKYGFDEPLWRQYLMFAGNALRGDLGLSVALQQNEPVTDMVLRGLRATAVLGLLSMSLAVAGGVMLGVYSALNHNRRADYGAVVLSTAGAAVPSFVLGIFLIYVFATQLHLLPTQGWTLSDGIVPGWLPQPRQMVLPVLALAALPAAYLARITRASLLEVLQQDYMRTARAKGLPAGALLWRHAMRNAAIPIASIFGPLAIVVFTGSFIIESLFSVPGIGRLFVEAVGRRDYNVILGMTMFYATIAVLFNLVIDIAYAYLDPRVRYR